MGMTSAKPLFGTKTKFFLLFIGVAVLCMAAYVLALAYELDGLLDLPRIQQALDEQCGKGVVIADLSGYNGDPEPSWSSPQASCYLKDRWDFTCTCYSS